MYLLDSRVDINQYRIRVRLRRIALQKMRDIYDSNCSYHILEAEFNYEMFKFALEDYLNTKNKQKKDKDELIKDDITNRQKKSFSNTFGLTNTKIASIFLSLFFLIFIIYQNKNDIKFWFK